MLLGPNFPGIVVLEVIRDWSHWNDVNRLDSAVTNHNNRPRLLDLYCKEYFVMEIGPLKRYKSYLKWCALRKIKFRNLSISRIVFMKFILPSQHKIPIDISHIQSISLNMSLNALCVADHLKRFIESCECLQEIDSRYAVAINDYFLKNLSSTCLSKLTKVGIVSDGMGTLTMKSFEFLVGACSTLKSLSWKMFRSNTRQALQEMSPTAGGVVNYSLLDLTIGSNCVDIPSLLTYITQTCPALTSLDLSVPYLYERIQLSTMLSGVLPALRSLTVTPMVASLVVPAVTYTVCDVANGITRHMLLRFIDSFVTLKDLLCNPTVIPFQYQQLTILEDFGRYALTDTIFCSICDHNLTLTSLSLEGCYKLTSESLSYLLLTCQCLTKLTLVRFNRISNEDLVSVFLSLPKETALTEFHMEHHTELDRMTCKVFLLGLPNLRKLHLRNCKSLSYDASNGNELLNIPWQDELEAYAVDNNLSVCISQY